MYINIVWKTKKERKKGAATVTVKVTTVVTLAVVLASATGPLNGVKL